MAEFKSGFISVIGRPNVGKSTLVNRVVQQKIAITSDKAQTTRNRVSGIYTDEDKQLVFIDTPGIHKPKNRLGTIMNENALSTLNEVDVVLFMVNANEKRGPGDNFIMDRLKEVQVPIFLIINKMDAVAHESFPEIVAQYQDTLDFKEIFPLSAKEGTNVDRLVEVLTDYLDEGPQYFPEDQVSDHPERFLVKEIIREKVLELTREEVPHSVAVTVEEMGFNEDGKMEVDATIVVERSSQKGIIIGKGGQMLKRIGTGARREIEGLLGEKVRLNLWVRVKENWRDRDHLLKNFGYYSDKDLE